MRSMRTAEAQEKYGEYLKTTSSSGTCKICEAAEAVKIFKYWRIIKVLFPWDKVATDQHMIAPKRHITYKELTKEEKKEFDEIKLGYIEDNFEVIAEVTDRKKSIPDHFHVHMFNIK